MSSSSQAWDAALAASAAAAATAAAATPFNAFTDYRAKWPGLEAASAESKAEGAAAEAKSAAVRNSNKIQRSSQGAPFGQPPPKAPAAGYKAPSADFIAEMRSSMAVAEERLQEQERQLELAKSGPPPKAQPQTVAGLWLRLEQLQQQEQRDNRPAAPPVPASFIAGKGTGGSMRQDASWINPAAHNAGGSGPPEPRAQSSAQGQALAAAKVYSASGPPLVVCPSTVADTGTPIGVQLPANESAPSQDG